MLVSADLAQAQHDLVPLAVQPDDLDRHLLPELDDVRELPDRGPCEFGDVAPAACESANSLFLGVSADPPKSARSG